MEPGQLDTRLAVYGTLAPGRSNEHELAHLGGTWTTGTVRGHLRATVKVETDAGPVAAWIYELAAS